MVLSGLGSSTCRAVPLTAHWAPSSHKRRLALLAAAAVFGDPSHGTGISKMLQCHCNWTALSPVASADFLQGLWPYHMVPSLDISPCIVTKVLSLSCSLRVLMTSKSWITWETHMIKFSAEYSLVSLWPAASVCYPPDALPKLRPPWCRLLGSSWPVCPSKGFTLVVLVSCYSQMIL